MDRLLVSGELYSLACAVVWAAAVILFRRAGDQLSPVALTLFKNVVGLALLLVTMPLLGTAISPAGTTWSDWVILLASGAMGIAIADTLFFASLNRLGAVGNAVVSCLYAPFIAITAFAYLGEPLTVGLAVALGVMVMAILLGAYSPTARLQRPRDRRRELAGIGFGAASMLAVALGIVPVKPVLERSDLVWASGVRLTGGVIFIALHGLISAERRTIWAAFRPGRAWRYALPATVLGTYLAMLLYLAAMKYTAASVAGVLTQISTLIIAVLAAIFLHEPLGRRRVAAVLMGFAGVALVTLW